MTITYSANVATNSLAGFLKLLFRWRGSIYKLLWKEFVVFCCLYYFFGFLYRILLSRFDSSKYAFEQVVIYCESFTNFIPMALILGFYINAINSRWWDQFCAIPWPDRVAMYLTTYISEDSDRARLMRRTVVRYVNLSIVMTLCAVSPNVKKRFPTLHHLTEAGILLPNEEDALESIQLPYNKYFVPLIWSMKLLAKCKEEETLPGDNSLRILLQEIVDIRSSLGMIFNYDWISVPLAYTQVMTLAVHMFAVSSLLGRQYVEGRAGKAVDDMYFPFLTFLQFFFYMGWMKVAEQMINPFGEDDDDFDVNFLLDRHIRVSYLIVDEIHNTNPDLIKDMYWDVTDFDLPYTKVTRSQGVIPKGFHGSAVDVVVDEEVRLIVSSEEPEEVIGSGNSQSKTGKSRTSQYRTSLSGGIKLPK